MVEEQIDKMPEIQGDDLGKLSNEQLTATLENDISQYEKQLEQLDKDEENYKIQLEIDEGIWAILEDRKNFGKINPEFKFEEKEEYWDLQHRKQLFKIRQDRHLAQRSLERFTMQRELLIKDRDDKVEKFEKLKGEKNE